MVSTDTLIVFDLEAEFKRSSPISIEMVEKMIRESFLDNKIDETETGLNRITFEVLKKLQKHVALFFLLYYPVDVSRIKYLQQLDIPLMQDVP